MYNKKIFIAGGPRCGTTLMQGLLCKDDETIPMTKESTYFNFLMEAYQKGKFMWNNHTHSYFKDKMEYMGFNRFITDNYFRQVYSLYPADVLVHKHPGMTKTFPDIMELYPDSLFIIMLRDPRDAIASYLKIKRDEGYGVDYFVNMFIGEFQQYMDFIKTKGHMPNTLYVRYEDLLLNTEWQMEVLRDFTRLLLDFDPTKNGWESNRVGGEYSTELDGKPIDASNIGRYKENLTEDELMYIQSRMNEIGYGMPMWPFIDFDSIGVNNG